MKKIILTSLVLFWNILGLCQTTDTSRFELVESIPIETNLDNPDIRNTHDVWLEVFNNAKSSLDIEQFYISNQKGEPLEDIIDAIVNAGARGVHIRIIVDSRMYKTYPETVDMLGKQKNTSVRIIDFGKLAGGIQHSKYFIADGEDIFVGSQNCDWRALKHIHELGVHFKHKEIAKIYQDIFDLDWKLAEKNDPTSITKLLELKSYQLPLPFKGNDGDKIIIIPTMSPKGLIIDSTLWDETQIVKLIDGAKNEVNCQFLTYSPIERNKSFYPVLDDAIRRAAARGVTVKMIVSDWSINHPIIDQLQNLARIPNIQMKFSAIPEWSGGYVSFARVEHCKYLVIDSSACWIGTSNWEKSYFYNCRNLGLIVKNNNIAKQVRFIFYKSWEGKYTKMIQPDIEYTPRKHGE
jgi:phosphatidylserine/phosphatidylglycerophosphate/cardiolipin synthase-like enzyme